MTLIPSLHRSRPKPTHPLGPLVYRVQPGRQGKARLLAGLVFIGCSGLLGVAAVLTPDPHGLGTHRQLGLAPCSLVALVGYPCPTCGMTTAFSQMVRGHVAGAFRAQPAGMMLALVTLLGAALSLSVVVTGRSWSVNWYRVRPDRIVLAVLLLVLLGWLYKLATGLASGTLPVRP